MSACYCRNCGARATRLVENGICEACKRRSDINPKNVLIAAALIVYIGVNVAAYIKDHPPRESDRRTAREDRRGPAPGDPRGDDGRLRRLSRAPHRPCASMPE
ncbi:hypothetical protein ACG3PX_18965 [Pseudomonas aeruginosa]